MLRFAHGFASFRKPFQRVRELQETLSAGTIALEISSRNARVQALQNRWDRMREGLEAILTERGQAMADVPGGSSGLYAKDYRGNQAMPVYRVDTGLLSLLSELRALEKQAAEEFGQWTEKRDLAGQDRAAHLDHRNVRGLALHGGEA